jgi:hypothetical protein
MFRAANLKFNILFVVSTVFYRADETEVECVSLFYCGMYIFYGAELKKKKKMWVKENVK